MASPGKELCDVLVVCSPFVLVISIKEISFKESSDLQTATDRWYRKAIESSINQIAGACRWLSTRDEIAIGSNATVLKLPDRKQRKVFRIAVALGSEGKVPLSFGAQGNEFTHIFNEESLLYTMRELDTMSDCTNYLSAVESLAESKVSIAVESNLADLTALYLLNGRRFPESFDSIFVPSGTWEYYSDRPERLKKVEEDKISYAWDNLIELMSEDVVKVQNLTDSHFWDAEEFLRIMALEDRFNRRILGMAFVDFYERAKNKETQARALSSPSGVAYMFLFKEHYGNRTQFIPELQARTFVARGMAPDTHGALGILIDHDVSNQTVSFTGYYLPKPDWTEDDQTFFEEVKLKTSAWNSPIKTPVKVFEYPANETHSKNHG